MIKLLEDLIELPGISGYEDRVRKRIIAEIKDLVKYKVDSMGNLVASLGSGDREVVVTAHMDEIGMAIVHIESDGFLRVRKIGGLDPRTVTGQPLRVITKQGEVPAAMTLKPPHLMGVNREEMMRSIPFDKMYLDIGAKNPQEVADMGVDLFDQVLAYKQLRIMNDQFFMARSIDNRIGCWILTRFLKELVDKPLDMRITFLWTAQEEIGLRGADMYARRHQPDFVIALDTITAGDMPGVPTHYSPAIPGKGPVLRMVDNRSIASPWLVKIIMEIGKEKGIQVQRAVSGGSTDAAAMQVSTGAHTVPLCFPLRYTHSACEMTHRQDAEDVLTLLHEVYKKLSTVEL